MKKLKEVLYDNNRKDYDREQVKKLIERINPMEIYVNNLRIHYDGKDIMGALSQIDKILCLGDDEPSSYIVRINPSFNQPILEINTTHDTKLVISEEDTLPIKEVILHKPFHKQFEDVNAYKKGLLKEYAVVSTKNMFLALMNGSENIRGVEVVRLGKGSDGGYSFASESIVREYVKASPVPNLLKNEIYEGVEMSIYPNEVKVKYSDDEIYTFILDYNYIQMDRQYTSWRNETMAGGNWYSTDNKAYIRVVTTSKKREYYDNEIISVLQIKDDTLKTVPDILKKMIEFDKDYSVKIHLEDGDKTDTVHIPYHSFKTYLSNVVNNVDHLSTPCRYETDIVIDGKDEGRLIFLIEKDELHIEYKDTTYTFITTGDIRKHVFKNHTDYDWIANNNPSKLVIVHGDDSNGNDVVRLKELPKEV